MIFNPVSLQHLSTEMADLKKGLTALEEELEIHSSPEIPDDKFFETMKVWSCFCRQFNLQTFCDLNRPPFNELNEQLSGADAAFKDLVAFFGEDAKTAVPESFFGVFNTFLQTLEAWKRNDCDWCA